MSDFIEGKFFIGVKLEKPVNGFMGKMDRSPILCECGQYWKYHSMTGLCPNVRMFAAGYKGKTAEFKAMSLWDAKQKAVALLKPTKKDAGLLWVLPVQKIETQGVTAFVVDPGLMN